VVAPVNFFRGRIGLGRFQRLQTKAEKLARVKQREWKKNRVDTIGAAPAIAAPGFHPGLFSVAPIRSELSAP
jgi:hypothetical protein